MSGLNAKTMHCFSVVDAETEEILVSCNDGTFAHELALLIVNPSKRETGVSAFALSAYVLNHETGEESEHVTYG